MNCKPGDLAVIVGLLHDVELNGLIVEVVSIGLPYHWVGPDGHRWQNCAGCVSVKSLGSGFPRVGVAAEYAPLHQRNLCPIRPGDISDEEVRDLYAPKIPEADHA